MNVNEVLANRASELFRDQSKTNLAVNLLANSNSAQGEVLPKATMYPFSNFRSLTLTSTK